MPRYYIVQNDKPRGRYYQPIQKNPKASTLYALSGIGVAAGIGLIGAGLYLNSKNTTVTPPGGGGSNPGGTQCGSCSSDSDCALACNASAGAWSCVNGECAVTCPSGCTSDSDCSGCGPNFVCGAGSCYQPALSTFVVNPQTVSIPTAVTYCVGQYIWNQNTLYDLSYSGGQAAFDIKAYDQEGNVLPGVPISWTVNANNSPFSVQAMPINSGGSGDGSLGSSGNVLTSTGGARVIVTAPSTPQNFNISSLPNSQGAGAGMLGPYTLGNLSIWAGSLKANATTVLVLATVSYPEVPACPSF